MKRIILVLVAMWLTACSQIDTGNVGVERTLGKVSSEALPPGVYFTMFKNVDEFTAKEVSFQLKDLTPKSRDNLTMKDVDIDVYYKTTPAAIPALFTKYQGDVVKHGQVVEGGTSDMVVAYSRVTREAREAVYKAIAGLDATTMHTKRAELAEAVRAGLQRELDANDKGAFVVTAVNVRNLLTDPAIEAAIRQRAETDQAIEKKRKELELEKAETARQMEVVERQAKGEVMRAQAAAKANEILAASITPQVLRLREIEAQRAIAAKDGNTTILVPFGSQPLVSVK